MAEWSQTWTYCDGAWHEGNLQIMGVRTHAAWLGSSVFDGARVFEGVMPDIDRHCQRVNDSATKLGLKPTMRWEEIVELAQEGMKKFDSGTALYVKPMYWAETGGPTTVSPEPDSTRFCLSLFEATMPAPSNGLSITVSPFRRPTLETMPTDAKSGCLYPNNGRAVVEANNRGFSNALVLDMLGNVAELATSNIFMTRDGKVLTPAPNGTFLNGITRQRIIALLRDAGHDVLETTLRPSDFFEADEIFSSGNYAKVMPVTRIEDRDLQPGPVAKAARDMYWDFAHA
ncbi:MAG: branched-chain amino acid aminotransferase [Pseudomonadota bacterium]